MTRRTRKVAFYVLVGLFLVIGSGVILYAEGWRMDIMTFKTEKVGAVFVRSFPDDASITLDGKALQNQSGFLSRGTFISNLFPKNYTLALKKDGYDAWSENAQVLPSLVAELKYAVLVPQKAVSIATSETVKSFFEAGGDIVTTNATGTIAWRGKTIGDGDIVSHSINLKNAIISSSGVYRLYDFTNTTTTNLNPILQKAGIKTKAISVITIDPYDDTQSVIVTPTAIWSMDLSTKIVSPVQTAPRGGKIEPFIAISPSLFAWAQFDTASNTSRMIVYDKFSGNITDSSLAIPGEVKGLAWIKNNLLGIIESDGSLYRYDVSGESLVKIADDVKAFYPTQDGTMVATLENQSVEIFSFTSSDYYRFNLPQMSDVRSLSWYKDENHLFVEYSNHVSFLDLIDTGLHNFTTVSEGGSFQYDAETNSAYLIDRGQKLIRFDFPN